MKYPVEKYCVDIDSNILQCMQVIDRSAAGIAIVVDDKCKLVGTISDGDIRRALLKGYSVENPIKPFVCTDCYSVTDEIKRVEVLDIMHARRFQQVPIVDGNNSVIGIHLLYDLLNGIDRPNQAIIMAGGRGTRLGSITKNIPKPMLNIAGRPILERIILHLVHYGIRRIYLSVNYLAEIVEEHFQDGAKFGCSIKYLKEEEPLGSGGSLSLLPFTPKEPILLINGDLVVDIDFSKMLDFHNDNKFYATMGVHTYIHQVPYGCINIDNSIISSLEEKPYIKKNINAGIYVLSPEAVQSIPQNTFFPITDLFLNAIENKYPCGAFKIEKDWIDIGKPKQLMQARGEL